jgi:signal transduction histidine kinase
MRELVRATVRAGGYDGRVRIVEEPDDAEVVAQVDAPKVERIVENLVRNALRHTPGDSRIEVRVESDGDTVTITVEDDGPGVQREQRERIFEPFERGTAKNVAPSGSGLGLAIVRRFARLHGGSAWVGDRVGGGASFHVRLPLRHS